MTTKDRHRDPTIAGVYAACDYYEDASGTGHANVTLEINQGDVGSQDESDFLAYYTNSHNAGGQSANPGHFAPIGDYAVYGFSGSVDEEAEANVAMWLQDRLVAVDLDVPSSQLADPGSSARKLLGMFVDAYAPPA